MEIERKWMVNGWPEGLPLKEEFAMPLFFSCKIINH